VVGCARTPPRAPLVQKQVRELRAYDVAGPFDRIPNVYLAPGKEEPMSRVVREFLWDHFHAHRLGTMKATGYNPEGDQAHVESFFIEPDENGTWRVHIYVEVTCYERFGAGARAKVVDLERWEEDAYKLKRTGATGTPFQGALLPEDGEYPGRVYVLELLSRDGYAIRNIAGD
jgi:hypothetical protein